MVEEGIPKKEVARRLSTTDAIILSWWYAYEAGGTEQLVSTVKHKHYTASFKLDAVKFLRHDGLSYDQASADLGISSSQTLLRWGRQYLESDPESLEETRKGRVPKVAKKILKQQEPLIHEQELEDRIKYLEMENAYLKKLNALVAEREKSEKRRRCEQSRNEGNPQPYPFEELLKLAGISRSTCCYILKHMNAPEKYSGFREEIVGICTDHADWYGYRRVMLELRNKNVYANHKLMMRLT